MNLTIEKMIYGGDGLARSPEGKAVFLPFVLPGEEVAADVVEERSGFIRAAVEQLAKSSEKRTEAQCPYFGACGGCHYQHTNYENQLELKRSILRETFQRIGKFEWPGEIPTRSGQPWNYRNRTRLKVATAPEFALGYHRMASHDLLPVEKCPISSPAINRVIAQLWELGRERHVPAAINEVEIFANHDDSALLLEIYGEVALPEAQELHRNLRQRLPEIKGITFFAGPGEIRHVLDESALQYKAGDKSFRVSAGSFFQTNRFLMDELVRVVTADASGNTAVDLYAGAGLFANYLAKRFDRVFAVESAPASAADLQANAPKNVTPVKTTTEEFLPKCINLNPEVVVADPPRAGMGEKATKLLATLRVRKLSYLSCDPTTLARDLRLLLESGYRIEEVHLIDLFPQTFHIESLVRLAR